MYDNFMYDLTHGMNHGTGLSYLIILKSQGGNGKSLFSRVLFESMQAGANVVDSLSFKTKTTGYLDPLLTNIDSTMLLVLNEMKGELETGLIKKLTGKNMVNARCLYTNQYRLCVFNGAIIGTTNFDIKVDNYNYAIERRLKLYNTKLSISCHPNLIQKKKQKIISFKGFFKENKNRNNKAIDV
ncbi:hypothetical protein CDIK_0943 [Cucumispora dikerogammari]|nr:hypothetical protein CDIK_0943 [Cucumispora dikerogammari]